MKFLNNAGKIKEAVIITVNGRGDTVSLAYEKYKRMKAGIELLEILAEAEDDVTIAENRGTDVALEKPDEMERKITLLEENYLSFRHSS